MTNLLRIILIEDIETDAELIQRELRKAGIEFTASTVESAEELEQQLLSETLPHIILSDYTLPRFNAMEALKIRNAIAPEIPFILVTGAQTEEIAVNSIKEGANDYILKSSLTRLPTAVMNSLHVARTKKEQNETYRLLQLREEKYRNLFEGSLVGMLRWRLSDGFILERNHRAKHFTHLFCDENNLFHDCFLNETDYQRVLQQLKESGVVENIEFQVNSKNKEITWLSLSAKLFTDEEEVEGVLQDISQSKESLVKLEQVNYELDRFVYHASHDLKSPLRSIMGLVDAARDSTSLDECISYLSLFEQCANRLEALVNDLLVLARSNRTEEHYTSFDFNKEVEESIHMLSYMEKIGLIHIEKHIFQEQVFYTDAVRLRIVLNNLITNAIKYHRFDQERPFIRIQIDVTADAATIEISDNGEGIPETHIPRLFDMFYRATNTSEGSGLGLYIVSTMLEKIDGDISLTSTVKEGTSFKIVLKNQIAHIQ